MVGRNSIPAEPEAQEATLLKSEVEICLKLPDAHMEEDILKWWPRHEALLPNLSRMARQYLGIPATSASCERVFSTPGRTFGPENQHTPERNCLRECGQRLINLNSK